MAEIPRELRNSARHFTRKHLAFLDRNWLGDVFEDLLAGLLHSTVKEHTSETSNTALREACQSTLELVDHVKTCMPSGAKRCRCDELNDGEHRPQPICHWCALGSIQGHASRALKTPTSV
jgi:hypothetical protein